MNKQKNEKEKKGRKKALKAKKAKKEKSKEREERQRKEKEKKKEKKKAKDLLSSHSRVNLKKPSYLPLLTRHYSTENQQLGTSSIPKDFKERKRNISGSLGHINVQAHLLMKVGKMKSSYASQ